MLCSYPSLERIAKLYPGPQVLLGHQISWTEKRDGSNLRVRLADGQLLLSTRHQEEASASFSYAFCGLPTYHDIQEAIEHQKDFGREVAIFGELLMPGKSPTRTEVHDQAEFVVFDIWDAAHDEFLPYEAVYQIAYQFSLPVVERWGISQHTTLDDLYAFRDKMLEIAKEKGREGVVLKVHSPFIYAKEKLDQAPLPKEIHLNLGASIYPPLPDSELMGAIAKVHADLGEAFADKTKAMPLVAQYVKEECEKHLCSRPATKLYEAYIRYIEGLR